MQRYDDTKTAVACAVDRYRRHYFKINKQTHLPSSECDALEKIMLESFFPEILKLEKPIDAEMLKRIAEKNKSALTRLLNAAQNNFHKHEYDPRTEEQVYRQGNLYDCDLVRLYEQCDDNDKCKSRGVGPKGVRILKEYLKERKII